MAVQATDRHQENVIEWLDERESRFVGIANQIWEKPETALTEVFASKLQADDLAADGFTITTNIADLPTAFMAEWSNGTGGPTFGFMGEYDALPGLSQERSPTQSAIVANGPGHGCGHNLLGSAALAATAVVKAWMQATGTAGTVRYYGCPAEETVEGKNFMARAGAFDDLDFAVSWHPGSVNTPSGGTSLASDNIKFRFRGRTAHAAGNPETGRSALDAVELMNIGVNFLREHTIDQARLHYVITNGGGAPNVVPDDCEVWYFIRSPERHQVNELTERVRNIARGAALMTETRMEETFISGIYNLLPNKVMVDRMEENLRAIGPIDFTPEEKAFAQEIASAYPLETRESILKAEHLPASLASEGITGEIYPTLDFNQLMMGGTDVADISWVTPTVQMTSACFPLGVPGHSWANTATAGMSIGHKGLIFAAKAMALTAADFVLDPDLLQAAKDEFAASTKGRPYVSPIPASVHPRTKK
ncbi:MAG TPA: amidohydrolase [Thermomicrobiales bacterium]|nr:amidohydrolase [Thermomicrobiales bacterium]